MNAVKKIFKLIRLGVFCRWFRNVKKHRNILYGLNVLFDGSGWYSFISFSFIWEKTTEHHSFWKNISEK